MQPYRPDVTFSVLAIIRLEGREIQVLQQLKQTKKLNQFKDQAGFNLLPTSQSSDDPALRYIISWLHDGNHRELTRKPTWRNFIQVLREIDLSELAERIEDFFARTTPVDDAKLNTI